MAFCAETLWAAALLSASVVGSDLKARFGDARSSQSAQYENCPLGGLPRLQPKSLAAGTLVVFKQALTPDNLRFEPEMTSYHVTISVASRPENRTSGTRRTEPPVFGVGMGRSIMGAVICCKSNIRAEGTPKPSPWNPALRAVSPPRKGCRPYESRPTVRRLDTAKAGLG